MENDPRQLEMFSGFDGSRKRKSIPELIEGVNFGTTCREGGYRKGGPFINSGRIKHCLVYCGDDRCDCGKGPGVRSCF